MGKLVFAWAVPLVETQLFNGNSRLFATYLCHRSKKKADVGKHRKMFRHVGLLFDEPPGRAGLSFT
jgi:hypothetical protein